MAKMVEDGFFDECLELGQVHSPNTSGHIRLSLVTKDGRSGLDIRTFNKNGLPLKGVFLADVEKIRGLINLISDNSQLITDFCDSAGSNNLKSYITKGD